MAIVTSISIKLLEDFVAFIATKIEEYFIPRIQEHVGYLGLTAASALLLLFVVVNFFGWKLRGNWVNFILEKIGEYCVPQIIREQVGYLTDYDSNMRTLKVEVEKLNGIQSKRQHSVGEAKKNGQHMGPGVDSWLTELKRINEEVKRILDDEARVNKRWLCALCPDLISRYKLSWEAKKKTQDVIELQKIADFESRIKIVDKIMEALKDDNTNAIGICGLGGMGKTTTAKKIDERSKAEKLFDVTVMAVVSQTPDLKNIQDNIAVSLGLTLDKDSEPRRVAQLQEEMKKRKTILVILDDVWERLDLAEVGIPFGDYHKGCKVILTSRNEDVCEEMGSRNNFKIGALSELEAWHLFKEMAGISMDSPNLSTAKGVAKKCGGLPLAIVTVGSALKNAKTHTWNDALQRLTKPDPVNVPRYLKEVYRKLELSYDFLKDQSNEAQSLLVLCCIFKEVTDIPIRDLVRYWMGLLMLRGIDELAVATDRVRTLVDNLKSCNLLLDNGKEDCIRMHDLVRDVIRFKATKGEEAFMLRYGPELKEWPTEGTDEQHVSVSLISKSNKIHDHPKQLARPKPVLLLLEDIHRYQEVPNNLEFEGMEELKVLQMRRVVIPSLPSLLSYLTNLRALCLHACKLESISTIGELQPLVILSFRGSSITELSREIGRLTHLRLLDLTDCTSLIIVSPGVIKSLIRLEELYLENSGLKWVVEEAKAQNEVTLAELGSLSKLRALVSRLPTTKFSGGINLFDKLVRFQLISYKKDRPLQFSAENEFQNFLALNDIDATTLADGGTEVLLQKTNSLKIRGVRGMEHYHDTAIHHLFNEKVKSLCELRYMKVYSCEKLLNVFSSNLVQSLQNLEELQVNDCHLLEVVFDFEGVNIEEGHAALVLPCLKILKLQSLPSLTYLFNEKVTFPSLEKLKLTGCRSLRNVFYPSMARGLVHLKYLNISNCKMMEEIVVKGENEEEDRTDKIVIPQLEKLELSRLPSFTSFCQGLYPFDLPSLMHVSIHQCPKMTTFSLGSPITPKLQKVDEGYYGGKSFWMCDLNKTIQQLFARKFTFPGTTTLELSHNDDVELILHSLQPDGSLCKLKKMHVEECNKLLHVVPSNLLQSLGNLEELTVLSCASLVEVFEVEGLNVEERDTVLLPKLKTLYLKDLTELKRLFNEKVLFPSLEKLILFQGPKSVRVECCNKLLHVVPSNLLQSLGNLEELTVLSCASLVEVFEVEGLNVEERDTVLLPKLKTLYLKDLTELKRLFNEKV